MTDHDLKKRKERRISVDDLKSVLRYDPDTGVLTWIRKKRGRRAGAGAVAGCLHSSGRIQVRVFDILIYAHRLAWALYYGMWPEDQIDHINRDQSDNRIANLREATDLENRKNLGRRITNTTGVTGVCWDKSRNKWVPSITVEYETLYLGRFDNFEDAVAARKAAEIKYGFSPTHGLPNQEIA
jgi:hypothetical protein